MKWKQRQIKRDKTAPVHQWWYQKHEGSQHGLACNAMDGPLELVVGTKHHHCSLENQKTKQIHKPDKDLISFINLTY